MAFQPFEVSLSIYDFVDSGLQKQNREERGDEKLKQEHTDLIRNSGKQENNLNLVARHMLLPRQRQRHGEQVQG